MSVGVRSGEIRSFFKKKIRLTYSRSNFVQLNSPGIVDFTGCSRRTTMDRREFLKNAALAAAGMVVGGKGKDWSALADDGSAPSGTTAPQTAIRNLVNGMQYRRMGKS
ncbi:MAG: twin-arginine translocation signal domain-containing protein, partial [Planctomycetes bacterium]|nr:twin-arginine translocation signal domain-containing protein [Planctomycetota bacterium]